MKLTETQRKFITDKLGVKAREKKGILHVRSDTEKKDDSISGALDEYLKRETKVLDSLRALEKVAGTEKLMAAFEVEIAAVQSRVRKAKREDGDKTLKQAFKDLEEIKNRASKEVETATGNPTWFSLLEATQKALEVLKSHPQKAHVQGEITSAEQKLDAAIKANDKRKYKDALARLAEAKKFCDDGKGFADEFNAYRIARAPAEAILANMKGQYSDEATWDGFNAKLAKADQNAAIDKRDYVKATAAVAKIKTEMSDTLKRWTKANLQARIDELKNGVQVAFVDADIKQLEAWRDSVDAKIAAGEWTGMNVLTTRALRIRVAATDRATRRQAYVDAKKKATDAIALLKPNTAMAVKVGEFEKILKDSADPLATAEAQRFEEAIDLCKKVETDCAALAKVAAASKKYLEDKKLLEDRLAALEKVPAAPHMTDAIKSLKDLQAEAEKRVTPGVDDWDGGLEWQARLATDLKAAEELAKTMAGSATAHEAATSAADEDAIKKAVAQIRAEAKKAAQPPGQDLVETELTKIAAGCEEALKQAAAKKLDDAKASLKTAADLLLAAQNVKGLAANFETIHAAATNRSEELAKLAKGGTYKALKPKVELLPPLLLQARNEAKARNFSAAAQTIGKADVAAMEAENLADAVKAFDLRAKPLIERQKKLKGSEAAAVQKLMAAAAKKANALDFAEAMKLLSQAQAKLETGNMEKLLKSGDDAELLKSAKELLKLDGGAEMLDEFVNGISDDAKFGVIASLAKERFGIDLTSDEGNKTLSAKAIWAVMAAVPEKHATHSPSLKSVKRVLPEDTSGAYNWFNKSVTMNGRPNNGKTENFDAETREKALGLPLNHDNSKDPYAPVDPSPGNLFNLTVLHEVGHAVDDRLGFMAGKAGQAAFGGWQQYTDLGEIAAAVAENKKYDKTYVLQLLNGYNPEPAPMPENHPGGAEAWTKAKKAVDDWYQLTSTKGGSQIWYSHSDSKKARIGDVVYQEAYANRWVSYLLPERTKGVTAYQWRAPGEWFAELYMAWYGKKLKPNHPFAPWLKTL